MQWSVTLKINAGTYSLSVVQKTAYTLAKSLSVLIRPSSEGFELLVTPVDSAVVPTEASARILLIQTLNDFALREQVFKETSGIRELLIRVAFKEAGF